MTVSVIVLAVYISVATPLASNVTVTEPGKKPVVHECDHSPGKWRATAGRILGNGNQRGCAHAVGHGGPLEITGGEAAETEIEETP